LEDPDMTHSVKKMPNYSSINALCEQLNRVKQNKLTGILEIKAGGDRKWQAYFYFGRMVWLSGGWHQVRCLYRQLKSHSPRLDLRNLSLRDTDGSHFCRFKILQELQENGWLTEEQACSIVKSSATDNLFDIFFAGLKSDLDFFILQDTLSISISKLQAFQLDLNTLLPQVAMQIDAWCQAGLQSISPNDAPELTTSPTLEQYVDDNFTKLASKIDGKRTIRDLAAGFKIDTIRFASFLLPYVEQGWIHFKKVADLSYFPTSKLNTEHSKPSPQALLVTCIDDSLQTIKMMEPIVKTAGHRFSAIQDSVQAIVELLELKPDLIFLDLMMPVVNGYEICAQLRRIPEFDRTPIIILTSNGNTIERLRSFAVKADGFLAKPVQANKILSEIDKYLVYSPQPTSRFH
jgi:two-component system, chemotaxis family, response regulator PixG